MTTSTNYFLSVFQKNAQDFEKLGDLNTLFLIVIDLCRYFSGVIIEKKGPTKNTKIVFFFSPFG